MGGNSLATAWTRTWTSTRTILLALCALGFAFRAAAANPPPSIFGAAAAASSDQEDHGLLQDLGLDYQPDAAKVNVSLAEYSSMMRSYLERLRSTATTSTAPVPSLAVFKSERRNWRRKSGNDASLKVRVPVHPIGVGLEVESAELRLLAAPLPGKKTVRVGVYQILGARRRRLVREVDAFLSQKNAKWCEFDVTAALRSWLSGEAKNLGLELECFDCGGVFEPLEAAITALVREPSSARTRRSSPHQYYRPDRRTDCKSNDKKRRCCRHEMTVTFRDLKLPPMQSIIQPKAYEAGFCKGRCPLNYNHATNHSRIQSLVHRLDQKATPRVCCAPSKLEHLEILRVNPADPTKLILEKWDNMKVLECACS